MPPPYLLRNPFTNRTRSSSSIVGSVVLYADFTLPVDKLRAGAEALVGASDLWDGRVVNVQVTDAGEHSMQLRVLVSASDSSRAWDMRCDMREKLIAYIRDEYPDALPRVRREEFEAETDRPAGGVPL